MQTPPPPIYRPAFHPPPPPKLKQPTCIFTGYHSRPTDDLDTLSNSSSLPQFSKANNPPCPFTRWRLKKKKKRLCIVFELFCLINNFMIWKRKKKEEQKKKKETFDGGNRTRSRKLWITKLAPYHWATETKYNYVQTVNTSKFFV